MLDGFDAGLNWTARSSGRVTCWTNWPCTSHQLTASQAGGMASQPSSTTLGKSSAATRGRSRSLGPLSMLMAGLLTMGLTNTDDCCRLKGWLSGKWAVSTSRMKTDKPGGATRGRPGSLDPLIMLTAGSSTIGLANTDGCYHLRRWLSGKLAVSTSRLNTDRHIHKHKADCIFVDRRRAWSDLFPLLFQVCDVLFVCVGWGSGGGGGSGHDITKQYEWASYMNFIFLMWSSCELFQTELPKWEKAQPCFTVNFNCWWCDCDTDISWVACVNNYIKEKDVWVAIC